MKAFITGGTGFIGSHLVDALISQPNSEIHCLIRGDQKWLQGKNLQFHKLSPYDGDTLREAMKDSDVVYHCAGVVKAPNAEAFHTGNVAFTDAILRTAIQLRVPKVVILSSLAAAGPSRGTPLTEADPMHPVSQYGMSKMQMETKIHERCARFEGTSVSIVRPPAVYGPREQDILTIFKMAAKGLCPIIGDRMKTGISMVHVQDLIEGMLLVAAERNEQVKTYYLSGEPPISWEAFRLACAKALGRNVRALQVNASLVTDLAYLVERGAGLFGVYPVFNREKAKELVEEWTCSTAKAQQELGYRPKIALESGVASTIAWYKRHHWI